MNKCFITQWLLVLYLSLLVGCTKDVTSPEKVGEPISLGLTLDTYAGEDSNAKEHEKAIHNLYVFIYGSDGRLENPDNTRVQPATDGSLTDATGRIHGSWKVYGGQKDIYVIANVPDKLASTDKPRSSSIVAADALRRPTKDELAKFCMPWIGGSGNINVMRYNDFDYQTSGFFAGLMSGKKTVKVTAANQNQSVLVPLVRRYARIDLAVRKAPELANSDVKILSMDWSYIGLQSTLLAADPESTLEIYARTATPVVVGQISAADYTPLRPASKSNEAYEMYSGVYPKQDDPYRYQQLTLNALVNNSQVVYELNLCETGTDGKPDLAKPLPIEANKIYKINATLTRHTSDVDIEIQDWSDKQIDGSIGGSTLGLDSVVLVKAGNETRVPVSTIAETVRVKLSDAAARVGYSLSGADVSTGILELPVTGGKAEIPVTGPVAYPVGKEYNMTVLAGNIRCTVPLRVDGTSILQAENLRFDYLGGTKNVNVKSYLILDDPNATQIPMPWTAEYSTDGGKTWGTSLPDGFTITGAAGNGNLDGNESFNVKVSKQSGQKQPNFHTSALRDAAPVSNYDLSTLGGRTAMNTANCYVVSAPGTYTLPLVYGNGIKDGHPNPSAYTSTAQPSGGANASHILRQFIDYKQAAITDPYIYNKYTAANACLVWQDAQELISDVKLSADGRNLTFSVSKESIQQGNAIVGIRDSGGSFIWSWHIWVTDHSLDDCIEVINFQKETFSFMPVNLGWVDGQPFTFKARDVRVKLTQPQTGASHIISVLQPDTLMAESTSPYYQWGRKDPMLPADYDVYGEPRGDKMAYYGDNKFVYAPKIGVINSTDPAQLWPRARQNIAWCIANPFTFIKNAYADCLFLNLWSAQNGALYGDDAPVVKTIYDPSPVGFCVPARSAFSGFTSTGYTQVNIGYGTTFNSPYTSANDYWRDKGWRFYCRPMPGEGKFDESGGTIYFPYMGLRGPFDGLFTPEHRQGVFYWSALPNGISLGHLLAAKNKSINNYIQNPPTGSTMGRAFGCSVRPVREK